MGNNLIAIKDVNSERPDTTARVFRSTDGGYLYCSADSGRKWILNDTFLYFTRKISKVIISEKSARNSQAIHFSRP